MTRRAPRLAGLAFVFAWCISACGEPLPPPASDAGSDAGTSPDAGLAPIAPAHAAPPRFDCPEGWVDGRVDEAGPTRCEPWSDGRPTCGPNERLAAGSPGCVPIGPECPTGDFPDGLPSSGIVYVESGSAGGDGSAARPFATIPEAVAAAADGDTVLVAAGEYTRPVSIDRPMTLRGVCLDAVMSGGAHFGVSADVTIESFRMQESFLGLTVWSGDVVVRDFASRDVPSDGVSVFGGTLRLENVSVRGARGDGVQMGRGAELVARGLEVSDASNYSLELASAADVSDAVVTVEIAGNVELIRCISDCDVRLSRLVVESSTRTSVTVLGGRFEMVDSLVRGPPLAAAVEGPGLFFHTGADVELTRVRLERGRWFGLLVGGASSLVATDLVIDEVVPGVSAGGGHGLAAVEGSQMELTRVWVERADVVGVLISDAATAVVARDLTVRDTDAAASGLHGRGIQVQEGASLIGERLLLSGNREASMVVSSGASARWTDATIAATRERACVSDGCDPAGIGLAAYLRASVSLERFSVVDAALVGVQVAHDGEIDLLDGEVARCPIGANVQVDGYDLERLRNGVRYRDNGVNLDTAEIVIPDPGAPTVPML